LKNQEKTNLKKQEKTKLKSQNFMQEPIESFIPQKKRKGIEPYDDNDEVDTASSGSATGRLHIIEGLRIQDEKMIKLKRAYKVLSQQFLSQHTALQTIQQSQRVNEITMDTIKAQLSILEKATALSIKVLRSSDHRNSTAVTQYVIEEMESAQASVRQMRLDTDQHGAEAEAAAAFALRSPSRESSITANRMEGSTQFSLETNMDPVVSSSSSSSGSSLKRRGRIPLAVPHRTTPRSDVFSSITRSNIGVSQSNANTSASIAMVVRKKPNEKSPDPIYVTDKDPRAKKRHK
jgi:hypothetical protein